ARRIEAALQARPAECLQAGLFTDAETGALKQSLESWPGGSWTIEPATEPARWIVYMGKYPDPAALEKKKAELRTLNVSFEPLTAPRRTAMSLKLYFAPGACSFVPHTLLETAGAPYEPVLVKLHKQENLGPEFRAINPRGQVPVLVADGEVITQILAIVNWLD